MKKHTFLWIILLTGLVACNSNKCSVEEINEDEILRGEHIEVIRHEDELANISSKQEMLEFLNNNPVLKQEFLGSQQYPSDTILADLLFERINHPEIQTLFNEVDSTFSDIQPLVDQIEQGIARMRTYYPDAKLPRIETMVTGFGSSEMFVSDSLIIIGLDYYLGPGATFRPNNYPNYIQKRYQKDYIVPAIFLIKANDYVEVNPRDRTMLADMIFYGKKYEFAKTMLPCTHDSLIIWYSEKELKDVKENQHIIWASFLENEILYETSHETKERFLGERPNTYEISAICPGRIGAWVGWEIVKEYQDKFPDRSFTELMSNPEAQKLFEESRYKARKPGVF